MLRSSLITRLGGLQVLLKLLLFSREPCQKKTTLQYLSIGFCCCCASKPLMKLWKCEVITRGILKILSFHGVFLFYRFKVTDNFVGQQRRAAVVSPVNSFRQPPATQRFHQAAVWAEVLEPEKALSSAGSLWQALRRAGFVQDLIAHI